jgi:PAS domain S-box-containing protein
MPDTLAQRRADLRWPSQAVLWAGGLLVLAVLAASAALALRDYRAALVDETARRELLARVLEDHATRTVETASIALASMADLLAAQPQGDATAIGPVLSQSLVGLPFMRSVAVLDRQGTVLASTTPDDYGRQIDLKPFGAWPGLGADRLGGFLPGRSLASLASSGAAPTAPAGVGFIPLLRQVQMRSGEGLLLVALINPGAFANYQSQALADERAAAAVASQAAEVLAATLSLGLAPGASLAQHPVFRRYLPAVEHAGYQGQGVRSESQVVAFRASRTRPMVVLVEFPVSEVAARWREANGGFAFVVAVAVLFLLAMTVIAWRGMRSRELAHRQLDQAQAEVARREQELSVTIRSVQELIFRTDAQGAITFVNDRWLAIGGTNAPSALGRTLEELVLPEQRAAVRALFSPDPDAGVRTTSATVAAEDGRRQRHFDVAVVPLQADGHIVGFAGSAADVTGRVVAQQRLQTQLAVTALMLEISPLPLSMLDLGGRYVSVNQAWEDFTGRPRAEAIGRFASSYLTPAEASLHDARDRELLERGGRMRYEARVRHRDGSLRDVVLVKVAVPGDQGEPAGILCVLMDVSEFREAERATREARDAAEEASRAKTEFIANISHELRTPLQSILGFSELGFTRGGQHERLAAMFAEINTSGKRMLALVNDLLDVAKIESTVGTFHLERTDLRPLVREVVHELSPLLAQRAIEVQVRLSALPLVAKVDPLRFQQVVRNVMANAIKFSPSKGRIAVEGETTAAGEIHLVVSDQGPGIPPSELDRVFDAFVQSSLTKDGSGGTGLGLAICRKILEAHGGHIHAENLAGGGTAFHIRLPARGGADTGLAPLAG